jgi:hypothetical protein
VEIDAEVEHVQVLSVCPSRTLVTVGTQAGDGDIEVNPEYGQSLDQEDGYEAVLEGQEHESEGENMEGQDNGYEAGETAVETEAMGHRYEAGDELAQEENVYVADHKHQDHELEACDVEACDSEQERGEYG